MADPNPQSGRPNGPGLLLRMWRAVYSAYCFFSFSHVKALIDKGSSGSVDQFTAKEFHPAGYHPRDLQKAFESLYYSEKPDKKRKSTSATLDVFWSLLRLEWKMMLAVWSGLWMETAARFAAPFFLREFLIWMEDYRDDKTDQSRGWLWGLLTAMTSFVFMLSHHRVFWWGFFMGYRVRTTLTAAIHSKLLRLNSACVARVTTGHIINLASNDLRRFDFACAGFSYLFFGPFEAVAVLVIVAHVLGWLPAIAGMSCILVIIPIQMLLSKHIGKCRLDTARITDKRINFTSEIITGSLAVKMSSWEESLLHDIKQLRDREHRHLVIKNYIRGMHLALPNITQGLVVFATFVTYRFTDGDFNVPDVFFVLSLMMLPRFTMANLFIQAVEFGAEAIITLKRLDKFFKIPEAPSVSDTSPEPGTLGRVNIDHGDYGWYETSDESNGKKSDTVADNSDDIPPQLKQTLANINLAIEPGTLVGVVGEVGSGKSSLLGALLRDMECMHQNDNVQMSGYVSFCSQIPWIMAGSAKENILFGHGVQDDLYQQVVSSCALERDFEQFPNGDNTEIGERGINISGGQKARLALARAAYSQAHVHLLDDPLSAVDPHVGRILFDKCIGPNGLMHSATRVLVTHQRQFLPECDLIVIMKDGRIAAKGTWDELSDHKMLKKLKVDDKSKEAHATALVRTSSHSKRKSSVQLYRNSSSFRLEVLESADDSVENGAQLVKVEEKETGKISSRVYWDYMQHIGVLPFVLGILLLASAQILRFVSEWWVATWASSDEEKQDDLEWIWVLTGLTAASTFASVISILILFALFVLGSTRLHQEMIRRVMRAPLQFFHTNPTGRILNRFAKDLGLQDEELPFTAIEVLGNLIMVLGAYVLVTIALPYMLIFFALISWMFWKVRVRYVAVSREIKRFDGVTRSPVFAMLSSNIKGLPTIRAFGSEEQFQSRFNEALELNGTWWTAFLLTSRWIGYRMDRISALVVLASVICSLLLAKDLPPEVLGLALTYSISLSNILQWTMRQSAELENAMTAVERNMEYTRLEQEPPTVAEGGNDAPEGWPTIGAIEFHRVSAAYRPGLSPVLKNLSFSVAGGTSVGIVGRTGSGKSSLLLTLFRLIELRRGVIEIDGVDIASLGIDVLRKQLAVIPQDPVLFGGTLRSNLDPWNRHSDAKIWDVLKQVCLDLTAKEIGGLDAAIAECGNNFSVGQRQLLCLGRALLADTKILALDEATANVDRTTDALIQKSLHALIAQNDKTLLIIAHRIDTIMCCDQLLVLHNGSLVESGSPSELSGRTNGVFASMARAAANTSSVL